MKKTGVFYGSTTGTTESVANLIAEKLGIASADVHNVSKMNADMVGAYEALILGTSTWGDGELQDDWYDGIKVLKSMDLKDKIIALFGCGDSESYGDTCNMLRINDFIRFDVPRFAIVNHPYIYGIKPICSWFSDHCF